MVINPRSKDFSYKWFMLKQLFKFEEVEDGVLYVQHKCFKIYYQELNCSK